MAKKEKRNYQHEYAMESTQRRAARAQRNRARTMMKNKGLAHVGDGKDVGHIKAIGRGGKNTLANLEMQSPHANRSFDRNSKHGMVSETSPSEKKKRKKQ